MLDVPARGKKCEAIEGIIDEAKEHMDEIEDEQVLDAGMISSAQAVEIRPMQLPNRRFRRSSSSSGQTSRRRGTLGANSTRTHQTRPPTTRLWTTFLASAAERLLVAKARTVLS